MLLVALTRHKNFAKSSRECFFVIFRVPSIFSRHADRCRTLRLTISVLTGTFSIRIAMEVILIYLGKMVRGMPGRANLSRGKQGRKQRVR